MVQQISSTYFFVLQFQALVTLVALLLTSTSAYSQSSIDASQNLFEEKLCLQVKFSQGQSLHDLKMVKQLGVKWVREALKWEKVEEIPGVYRPLPESLQKRLRFYKDNDIGVIFMLAYENPIAYPNTQDKPFNFVNSSAYAGYAAYMAKELKKSGVKYVLELWNEPHNSDFAKQEYLGGNWQGAPPSPWVDHYVAMVHETVNRVKAVDINIPVITDDDMWVVHYHFLDKGLPTGIDGFAIHPYSGGRPPEIAAVEHDAKWTQPYQVVDVDQSFESGVRRLIEYGEKKLGKTPNIWITEWGWRVGEQSPNGVTIDEQKVADYLPRAMILAVAAKVKTVCWFSAQDIGDGPMGLKTNNGRLRPAYSAFLKLSKTLGKMEYKCELKHSVIGERRFAFNRNENWIIAAWNASLDSAVSYQEFMSKVYLPTCK